MKKLFFLLIAVMLTSCGIKKNINIYGKYPPKANVQIIHSNQSLPEGIVRIGSITLSDSGFTLTRECTYEACIQTVLQEASKAGADIAYIVQIKEPNEELGGSTCYTIIADLYIYK